MLFAVFLTACSSAPSEDAVQTAIVHTEMARPTKTLIFNPTTIPTSIPLTSIQPTATNTPTKAPTATPQPSPTTVSEADAVLLISGFVHFTDEDGIDTCRVEGCKVYKSISDGINAWTYPGGSLFLIIDSSDQYNTPTQKVTLTFVITQLFGENVNSWINDHLAASVNANQDGFVDGWNISIASVEFFGMKLTYIVIGSEGT